VVIDSSHFAEAMQGRIQIRKARWKAGAALNVPPTRRQDGGVTTDCILAESGENKSA
jgi:hypothetical protein